MNNSQLQQQQDKDNGLKLIEMHSEEQALRQVELSVKKNEGQDLEIIFGEEEKNKVLLNSFIPEDNKKGFYVAHLNYSVIIGRWHYEKADEDKKEIIKLSIPREKEFLAEHIQKVKFFNKDLEILLINKKSGGPEFNGRIRRDYNSGDRGTYCVECQQALFGTQFEKIVSGWGKLTEERGTEIIIPFDNLIGLGPDKPLFIKIRNYVDFHRETNQAYYTDCRLVSFIFDCKELA